MGPESPAQHVSVCNALNLHALLLPEEHWVIQTSNNIQEQDTTQVSHPDLQHMCRLHHESGTFHYGSFLRARVYRYCMCSDGTIFHKTFESSPIGLWIWFGNMYRNVSDVLFIIHCTHGQCKPLDFHLLFKVLMSFAIQSCELQWYYSLVDVFTIPWFFNWIWPALFDQYRTYRTLLSLLLQYLFIVRLYIVN